MKTNVTEVKLLRVLDPFPVALTEKMGSKDYPDFPGAPLKFRDQTRELLAKTGFKTTYFVEEDDAREVILDCAERWPTDLIVVGSHGRKGLNRFLMGSVSEVVARYAQCSVQMVRP